MVASGGTEIDRVLGQHTRRTARGEPEVSNRLSTSIALKSVHCLISLSHHHKEGDINVSNLVVHHLMSSFDTSEIILMFTCLRCYIEWLLSMDFIECCQSTSSD